VHSFEFAYSLCDPCNSSSPGLTLTCEQPDRPGAGINLMPRSPATPPPPPGHTPDSTGECSSRGQNGAEGERITIDKSERTIQASTGVSMAQLTASPTQEHAGTDRATFSCNMLNGIWLLCTLLLSQVGMAAVGRQ
jgi:hypothetical protein